LKKLDLAFEGTILGSILEDATEETFGKLPSFEKETSEARSERPERLADDSFF
jgi:hypothetical protein